MTPWQQAIRNITVAPVQAYHRCLCCGAVIPPVAVNGKARKFCSEWCNIKNMEEKKKEAKRNARLAARNKKH